MKLTFKIGGVDFSDCIQKYGYAVSYEEIEGKNSGYMLNGSYKRDIVARKANLSLTCNPLKPKRLASILSALSSDYVNITYYDTKTGTDRDAIFMPTVGQHSLVMLKSNGVAYWDGLAITLKEQ